MLHELVMQTSHMLIITIGDFSGDGHEKTTDFYYLSNVSRDEARDAYFAAKEKLPDCCPGAFCNEYEDRKIREPHLSALRNHDAPMPKDVTYVHAEEMAALTVWFLKQGNPAIELTKIDAPSLMFCGPDSKGRLSDSIGYGCFY